MKQLLLFLSTALLASHMSVQAAEQYSLSLYGDTKYGDDFTHFDYANPNAPKGGKVVISGLGSFDSFNPYIPKDQVEENIGLTIATLMLGSDDEPMSEYPYIAKSIEKIGNNEGIIFHIDPSATFHDGSKITAQDFVATFNYLRTQGNPFYGAYYRDVDKVEATDEHSIKFSIKNKDNRELQGILGQVPVLKASEITDQTKVQERKPFTGSGPYKIKDYKLGQYIIYERVKNNWAENKPVLKGRFNYDEIRVDYYRDEDVTLEAFKSGQIDVRLESSAKRWATAYEGDKFKSGQIRKIEIPNKNPAGMQAFAFNTRRPLFSDPRVRQALGYAYDFEWANTNLFHGAYTRSTSYFSNSDCASTSTPVDDELALLEKYKDKLSKELFTQAFVVPTTKGDGNIRDNIRKAVKLLNDAGWKIKDNKLVNTNTGQPFIFDLLLYSPDFERVALPFKANLEKLGITMNVRVVDTSQYIKSIRGFEFDMIVNSVRQSLSPGNEQRDFWHSTLVSVPGSRNVMGVNDPVVDDLIEKLIRAETKPDQLAACRALDRVLLWGHYVIPHWHISAYRVAFWNKFGMPDTSPPYNDYGFYNWWITPPAAH